MPIKSKDSIEEMLARLIGATSKPRILSLLLSRPQQAFYQQEIMYESVILDQG